MDVFRATPEIVRTLRVLWQCLPAAIRRKKLIDMMMPSYRAHVADPLRCGDLQFTDYRVLGQKVCRTAFRLITGIGNSSLQSAREAVLHNKVSSCGNNEIGRWMLIISNSKPAHYLDCRQWLERYADSHADQSPHTLTSYLPGGRTSFDYLIYEHDRNEAGLIPASLQTFLHAWR